MCHSTVGKAILNTSITIVFGFSILVLSSFQQFTLGFYRHCNVTSNDIGTYFIAIFAIKIKPFEN